MQWGNWCLVTTKHPPVLRNPEFGDIELNFKDVSNSCAALGPLGIIIELWSKAKNKASGEESLADLVELMNALSDIYSHSLPANTGMTFTEAAYSFAAQYPVTLETGDYDLRIIRLRQGLAVEQDWLESLRRQNKLAYETKKSYEAIKAIQADIKEQERKIDIIKQQLSKSESEGIEWS